MPNGRHLLVGLDDGRIDKWDVSTRGKIETIGRQNNWVRAIAVTPDGQHILTGAQGLVLVWDVTAKEQRPQHVFRGHYVLKHGTEISTKGSSETTRAEPIVAIAVSPRDGKLAVSASLDGTVKIWDITNNTEPITLQGESYPVSAIVVTPDGQQALLASEDKTVKIWSLPDGRERPSLEGHTREVNAVAITRKGRYAISVSDDQMLKVWELTTGHNIATFYSDEVLRTCAVAPDGVIIVAAGISGQIHILRLEAS